MPDFFLPDFGCLGASWMTEALDLRITIHVPFAYLGLCDDQDLPELTYKFVGETLKMGGVWKAESCRRGSKETAL